MIVTAFEKSIRDDIQMMQAEIRIARDYDRREQLVAYDGQLQGYLTALRLCLSDKVYRTVTEGLVD